MPDDTTRTAPAPASLPRDSGVLPGRPRPEGPLICAPAEIFDTETIFARIDEMGTGKPDPQALRNGVVEILRDATTTGRAAIETAFAADPFAARPLTRSYTYLTDGLIAATFHAATTYLHPLPNPTATERMAVVAVGGYGRGEMAPFSDVDLLFLTPYKITAWAESVIESMLYMLWDLKLKVGHASRTIKDCIRLGREDFTIRTTFLEHRFLTGDTDLAGELADKLHSDLFSGGSRDFIEAKLEERAKRHQRQGARYMVEPNVKEGKGGLRDLQSLFWIAKYLHGVQNAAELVPLGVFRPEEFESFAAAESFLWAVRSHLHLLAGRPNEKLTFDMQVEVASRLGYTDKAGRRAVEVFMQDYFRHATRVGDLTRIFLTKLEATHTRSGPLLERLLRRRPRVRPGYKIEFNRLGIENDKAFLADKLNLLRLFEEGLRTDLLIHPDAMRLVAANLHLIDDEMRNDDEAAQLFIGMLLNHGNPERALRRMNELGVLAAFLPEFEPIVAMMQFNMYHSYTVDEHTIQCIGQLARLERGELEDDLPVSSRAIHNGINRKVMYIALLLHDIGKGRPEDHSILGAEIAHVVCRRLGLTLEECETVEWLVRSHLLMSDMAQKRDIADPRTVSDFASAVETKKRLDLLLILTVCDIRGVGPDIWNNWKASLIRALYRQTARSLDSGTDQVTRETREAEAIAGLRAELHDWPARQLEAEIDRHYPPYWQGLHITAHVVFARLMRELVSSGDPAEIRIDLHPEEDMDVTRACFAMVDHPGIFARLAGALALVGANICDARTYTTKDGYVTATFWIQDHDGNPYEVSRLPRLTQMIHRTLKGEVVAREALKSRDKIKPREQAFKVPTKVIFDNDGSDIYTIIEVDTRDRPGLLYDLARSLAEANIYIASAVVATYGEQAVDTFYVKDMFGLKYHTPSKQKRLEERLIKAVADGAERAQR
ncbi:[protein-PII] uridylyltransferase [Marinibacterium sp. SX1]|uniref:[protein-PII] uridylyltransferase n=1 Tax=Marinibacterium sp. SX1 TaxID=3388424 RepID=UPI003D1848D1